MQAGFYTIASGLLTRQRELDVIGNNLINIQTPGYRADRMTITAFEQELLRREERNASEILSESTATTVIVDEVHSLFNAGTAKETGRPFDIAINGDGFFNITQPDGSVALTRNGQFAVDGEGFLVLPNYGRVLGDGGEIQIEDANGFSVETDGTIYDAEGNQLGRLLVTVPPVESPLIKMQNGLFQLPEGAVAQPSLDYRTLQGTIELSNVDMTWEMSTLMEANAAYKACASALEIIDGINRKAATQIAALT